MTPKSISQPSNTTASIRQLRVHNSTLPAVVLPPELLGHIFLLPCRHMINPDTDTKVPRWDRGKISRTMRSSLMATCYSWRDLVISTTSLWNCIHVYLSPETRGKASIVHPLRRVISLDLERSLSRLLDIQVEWGFGGPPNLELLVDLLLSKQVFARCQRMEVICHPQYGFVCSLPPANSGSASLPHLQSLIVPCLGTRHKFDMICAPLLEELSYCRATHILNPHLATNLMRLQIDNVDSISVVVELLKSNPRLQLLSLDFDPKLEQPVRIPAFHFPSLLRLSIDTNGEAGRNLFADITAPNLQHLRIVGYEDGLAWWKFPKLQYLEIESYWHGDDESVVKGLLKTSVTLNELIVYSVRLDSLALITLLSEQDSSGSFVLFPSLRVLDCQLPASLEKVESLLQKRNPGLSDKSSVKFAICNDPSRKHLVPADFVERNRSTFIFRDHIDIFDSANWNSLPFVPS